MFSSFSADKIDIVDEDFQLLFNKEKFIQNKNGQTALMTLCNSHPQILDRVLEIFPMLLE